MAVAAGVVGGVEGSADKTADARAKVYLGDNLNVLRGMPSASVDLIYIDPPFNTGHRQLRSRFRTENDRKITENSYGYEDSFDDFIGFLEPRMREAHRILKPDGSLFFHIDYREVHYCKVMLDGIFGRESFINEIIWAYDYGARSKRKWSAKHDNILWYAKDPERYTFNYEDMDRIPYMAPGLVGPEKAARGKTPTDVWWHTIVSPNSHEKTGYATQKPRGVVDRIVKIHSRPGDVLMDFFAGSGTLGESALELGRRAILVDSNPDAIAVMKRRFAGRGVEWVGCDGIAPSPPRHSKGAEDMQMELFDTEGAEDGHERKDTGIQGAGGYKPGDAEGIRGGEPPMDRLAV
ncbi:MAG: site-specific DNA-methyltransferase [Kiritimatiellae bacterium]|nr:site-specific DNA-methyltransferase [Kiritimatiellia bacterium]